MISSVMFPEGSSHLWKLSTRAQCRLEKEFGQPIGNIISEIGQDVTMTKVCQILAAVGADGTGIKMEEVYARVDAMGITGAAELIAEIAVAAFPQPEGSDDEDDAPPEK